MQLRLIVYLAIVPTIASIYAGGQTSKNPIAECTVEDEQSNPSDLTIASFEELEPNAVYPEAIVSPTIKLATKSILEMRAREIKVSFNALQELNVFKIFAERVLDPDDILFEIDLMVINFWDRFENKTKKRLGEQRYLRTQLIHKKRFYELMDQTERGILKILLEKDYPVALEYLQARQIGATH